MLLLALMRWLGVEVELALGGCSAGRPLTCRRAPSESQATSLRSRWRQAKESRSLGNLTGTLGKHLGHGTTV